MELHADKPWMVRTFDNFGQFAIGRHAAEHQPALFQRILIMDIHFVTVAMPLGYVLAAVNRCNMAVTIQHGIICAQTHRAAHVATGFPLLDTLLAHPFGNDAHDGFFGRAKFRTGCARQSCGVSCALNTCHLHAQADAKKGHLTFTGEFNRRNLAFGAAFPKSARDQDRVHRLKRCGDVIFGLFEQFGVNPFDVDLHAIGQTAMR